MRRAALYICYYNVTEPLVQTQVVGYLRELARRGIDMHLLTFERDDHSARKRDEIRGTLARDGICWHTLQYSPRPWAVLKLLDVLCGSIVAFWICLRRHRIRLVHARSHVPAAMALPLKYLLGCRLLFDVRGLIAEEYLDVGHWGKGGLKFQLTTLLERTLFRRSDALVFLTHMVFQEMTGVKGPLHGRDADITVIPCCADVALYALPINCREAYRNQRGWADRIVLIYAGKLGTWYLVEEMAAFFAALWKKHQNFFFQILTQSDSASMREALIATGIPADSYDIRFIPPVEVPLVVGSADVGISLIRPCFSKRSSSPTKVGEYLAAGIPIITTPGIGDCDTLVKDHRLGVLVPMLSPAGYDHAAEELCSLLQDPTLRRRCLEFAEKELSLDIVGAPRYFAIYNRLLRRRHARPVLPASLSANCDLKD